MANATTSEATQDFPGARMFPDEGTEVVEAANAVLVAPSGPAFVAVLVSVPVPQYAAIPSAFLADLIPAQVHLDRGWPGPAVVPLIVAPVSVWTQKQDLGNDVRGAESVPGPSLADE
jgi:hypothetical protein